MLPRFFIIAGERLAPFFYRAPDDLRVARAKQRDNAHCGLTNGEHQNYFEMPLSSLATWCYRWLSAATYVGGAR